MSATGYGDASDPDWCSYLVEPVDEHAEWMRMREALTRELALVFYEGSLYGMATHQGWGYRDDFDVWPLIQGGLDISREGAFYITREWFCHVRRYGKSVNASFLGECEGWTRGLEGRVEIDLLGRLRQETNLKEGEGADWHEDGHLYRVMRRNDHLLMVNARHVVLRACLWLR